MIFSSCIIFTFSVQDKATANWTAIQCHGQISKWEVVALAIKPKRGTRPGSLLLWWVYPSHPVPKVKKEINSHAQGVNPFLDQSRREQCPLVPQACICALCHMVASDLWCSAVLATTLDIVAREQGVWTGYLQNITACCRSAPSLLCAALIANMGVSSVFHACTNPGDTHREPISAIPSCDAPVFPEFLSKHHLLVLLNYHEAAAL